MVVVTNRNRNLEVDEDDVGIASLDVPSSEEGVEVAAFLAWTWPAARRASR
jgi:hypothetical protein